MFLADYREHSQAHLDTFLLWDFDLKEGIKWEEWRSIIIERVVNFGSVDDWYCILNTYGLERLREEVLRNQWLIFHRGLISVMLDLPKEKISCYTLEQSNQILLMH